MDQTAREQQKDINGQNKSQEFPIVSQEDRCNLRDRKMKDIFAKNVSDSDQQILTAGELPHNKSSPTINISSPISDTSNENHKRNRREPLTIEEYETRYRRSSSDLELIERVFAGGMATNQLRTALWPYLFGLVPQRGRFERIKGSDGCETYLYVEHEANIAKWRELQKQYYQYHSQWIAIQPDQETRFSMFRERKSLIEWDVIRCDRLHPFYSDSAQNLATLTNLLMTYMMFDFDIGYMQGMSDLAAPILFMYKGDLVKAFWVFVEVMKLLRRNFECSQKSVLFQINCLSRLIKITDSKFARYLAENEPSNCKFACRWIMCQFKRELMYRNDPSCSQTDDLDNSIDEDAQQQYLDDYNKVLILWDTIWSVQRRHELLTKIKFVHTFTIANSKSSRPNRTIRNTDRNQADMPRFELTETEKFVLSLCLALIRRERDQVLLERLDSTAIHELYLKNTRLPGQLDDFMEKAYDIYHLLNTDCDMQLVVKGPTEVVGGVELSPNYNLVGPIIGSDVSTQDDTSDTFDLLRDYLIISPTCYRMTSR